MAQPSTDESEQTALLGQPANYQSTSGHDDEFADVNQRTSIQGDRVEIYWPLDDRFYPGCVEDVLANGDHVIMYDDNDQETAKLCDETWHFGQTLNPQSMILFNQLQTNEQ